MMLYKVCKHIYLVGFIALFGCVREVKPPNPPTLSFDIQASELSLQIPDTLFIPVRVADESGLTLVRLSILNLDGSQLGPALSVQLNGEKEFNRTIELPVTETFISSGVYQLSLYASNGNSQSQRFLPISIAEVPKNLLSIVAITKDQGFDRIWHFNSNFDFQLYTINSSFVGGGVSPRTAEVYFVTSSNPELYRIKSMNNGPVWLTSSLAASSGRNWNAITSDRKLYIAQENGITTGLDESLLPIFQYASNNQFRPIWLRRTSEHLLIAEQERSNVDRFHLRFVHPVGRGVVFSRAIDFEPVEYFRDDTNSFIMFGNKNGRGYIYKYFYSSNLIVELHELAFGEKIDKVWFRSDSPNALFFTDAKNYSYNLATNILQATDVTFGGGARVTAYTFEPLSGTTITSEQEFGSYSLVLEQNGRRIKLPVGGNLREVYFLYNR